MLKKLILLLIAIFLIGNVFALGITPGRTTFKFEPGTEHTVTFTIVNTEKKDMDLVVIIQGELNESISISDNSFSMSSEQKSIELEYTFVIPDDLKPGPHSSEIVALQLPSKSGTSEAYVGAVIGVATQLSVFVPYPGKFIEAGFNIFGPGTDGKITFIIPALSRGELDLIRVSAIIDIYNSLNEKIATLSTNEASIPSGDRRELVAVWTPNVAPGSYRAIVTIIYDGQTLTIEKDFTVSGSYLKLRGLSVKDFNLGDIAKFDILVENTLDAPMSKAFAQMFVYGNGGSVLGEFQSQTYNIPALGEVNMVAFWDTANVVKGVFDATLILRAGEEQSVQQDLNLLLELSDNEVKVFGVGYVIAPAEGGSSGLFDNSLVVVLITVIAVLIIINVLWFLVIRKKLVQKNNNVTGLKNKTNNVQNNNYNSGE